MAKRALRKGLDEIFGDIDSALEDIQKKETNNSLNISISEIRPNPYQPRKVFDKQALEELASSIKEHGVFTPILVKKSIQGYELVAGERRLRASKLAGKKDIPAIIVDFDDKQMMEISLLENIQREDLNAIEEAKAYEQLIQKLKYTQEQCADRVGKSRTYVTNSLRLLKLPIKVQEMLSNGKLSMGHARALLAIEDEDKMMELANRCVNENLTVRDIEKLAREDKGHTAKKPVRKEENPYLAEVKHNIESKLSTKVELDEKKMVIHYSDTNELNRILELLDLIEK